MKILLGLLLMSYMGYSHAIDLPIRNDGGSISYGPKGLLSKRGTFTAPTQILDVTELNRALFSDMKNQSEDLKKVKYYLLNGETRLAKAHLLRLRYLQTSLKPLIYRYLAVLSFIDGEFSKTYEYLLIPELQEIPHFSKVCVLRALTQIVLNKTRDLESQWDRCKTDNFRDFRQENLIWLETLVALKLNPQRGITKVPFKRLRLAALDLNETKMMMKLALYLNQEKLLVEQIPYLELEQLQDPQIRELAGQALFRTGALAKSYRFIEDLRSPNAENIKGNLYLLRTKYELAYAQFKLALEQKKNSQNAMERLLPLAWLLGDWEGGSRYAEQVIASPQTQINKLTLLAAFLMQKGDYERSNKILESISRTSLRGTELEVTQLASFTGLMQNKADIVKKQAKKSCHNYDLVNCWVLFQMNQWEAFPLTIRRDETIPVKEEWEKLAREDLNEPLKEEVFVNQIDIEEMDDKLIQLISTSSET